MCQAIFNRIWIHEDGTVTTEFTDIYKNIVGPIERDLINQNIKSASAETDADFIDKLLKSYSNFFGQGLNNELLANDSNCDTNDPPLALGGSLEFPVVQQCGNEDNKAGTGVMNQCACGRIQQFQKRQYDGCGIDAHG